MNDERAKEVVEKLRRLGAGLCPDAAEVVDSAADEIERLRAALKPFAVIWASVGTAHGAITLRDAIALDNALEHAAEVLK